MDYKDELRGLRTEIESLDTEMLSLFERRMALSEQVADVKLRGNMGIVDNTREQERLTAAASAVSDDNRMGAQTLMRTLMALSKLRQQALLTPARAVDIPPAEPPKTDAPIVAFQGVKGAWGEHAAHTLYPSGHTRECTQFEDVFDAVTSGAADYGVLPIENSQTGAIGEVYDLLRRYGCYIVGGVWITVAQCLLVRDGTKMGDIREVLSHPEGLRQCRRYLQGKPWEHISCRNTAVAARQVSQREDNRAAAIGSRRAAQAYGLTVLEPDVMDHAGNKTRFIAIAKAPQYDERSHVTSITFSTLHRSGALCQALEAFMVAGINLTRIESRPLSADSYRFFADLEASVLDETAREALRTAAMSCDYFEILGCYTLSEEGDAT